MGGKFRPKVRSSKVCFRCKNHIREDENYATLVSHSQGKIVNQDHFHAECWKGHVQDWVLRNLQKIGMETIQNVPGAMEFLKKFQNGGAAPVGVN